MFDIFCEQMSNGEFDLMHHVIAARNISILTTSDA